MKTRPEVTQLIRDLWRFIEDVSEDDPERTDKFFALRERVRNFHESEGTRARTWQKSHER
jgi:hypothetical protein